MASGLAKPLADEWKTVAPQIAQADRVLLACDFDGTLAPIASRPEDARILPESASVLNRLAELPSCSVAIVSGRALADVRALAGIDGVIYSGNHGMEIQGPGIDVTDGAASSLRPAMKRLRQELASMVGRYEGAFVEDKSLSLSVHYRLVSDHLESEFEMAVHGTCKDLLTSGEVIVVRGKKVLDIRPAVAWDKGKAMRFLRETADEMAGGGAHLPIYVGDDTTDEDAFREVNAAGGVSVCVGPQDRPTEADWRLDSPTDVTWFLGVVLEARSKTDAP